jgi:hypothetical protein
MAHALAHKPLSARQRRFVGLFVGEAACNARKAAALAGYPPGHGWRLCSHPAIKQALADAMKASEVSAEEVVTRLAEVSRFSPGDYAIVDAVTGEVSIDFHAMERDGMLGMIRSVSRDSNGAQKIEFASPDAATALLAKILKLTSDGPGGITVNIQNNVQAARMQDELLEKLRRHIPTPAIEV